MRLEINESEKNRIRNLHRQHFILNENDTNGDNGWLNPADIYNFIKTLTKRIKDYSKLPLHIRNTLKFISLKKTKDTNEDYTNDEISFIANTLCTKSKKYGNCNPSKWPGNNKNLITPDDYGLTYESGSSYTENISKNMKGVGKKLTLGLGNSTVVDSGTEWLLTDNFDFINATEFPDRKEIYSDIYNAIPDIIDSLGHIARLDDWTKYLERIFAWVHKTGYNGYRIELRIPKDKCQFCSKGNS